MKGQLKVNVDGSFNSRFFCGGVGVVVRDDKREHRAAISKHITYCFRAIACKELVQCRCEI